MKNKWAVITMFKEEKMLRSSWQKMVKILEDEYPTLKSNLNRYIMDYSFPNGDDYALLSSVAKHHTVLNRLITGLDIPLDYQQMMESYLDVSLCLVAQKKRLFDDKEMEECKKILSMNRFAPLSPRQKDLSYIGCTLENIINSKSLKDYRSYKKYYCNLLGL